LEGVEPTKRHVNLAYKWLDNCAHDIELDEYANWWRSQHQLKEEEVGTYEDAIESEITTDIKEHGGGVDETYMFKFIEYLAKNEKSQRDELAAYLSVDSKTVSRKANLLKGLGLLRSDMNGYYFTAKGVRFLKQWLTWISPFTSHVLNVPNVSAFLARGVFEKLLNKHEKYPLIYSRTAIQVTLKMIGGAIGQELFCTDPDANTLYNTVFPFSPLSLKTEDTRDTKDISLKRDILLHPKTADITDTDSEETLNARTCRKWHTGACSFPGDPSCLASTNPCAKTCKDYEANEGVTTEKRALVKGAVDVLNGTSGSHGNGLEPPTGGCST
jgi:hypothetical protein